MRSACLTRICCCRGAFGVAHRAYQALCSRNRNANRAAELERLGFAAGGVAELPSIDATLVDSRKVFFQSLVRSRSNKRLLRHLWGRRSRAVHAVDILGAQRKRESL